MCVCVGTELVILQGNDGPSFPCNITGSEGGSDQEVTLHFLAISPGNCRRPTLSLFKSQRVRLRSTDEGTKFWT